MVDSKNIIALIGIAIAGYILLTSEDEENDYTVEHDDRIDEHRELINKLIPFDSEVDHIIETDTGLQAVDKDGNKVFNMSQGQRVTTGFIEQVGIDPSNIKGMPEDESQNDAEDGNNSSDNEPDPMNAEEINSEIIEPLDDLEETLQHITVLKHTPYKYAIIHNDGRTWNPVINDFTESSDNTIIMNYEFESNIHYIHSIYDFNDRQVGDDVSNDPDDVAVPTNERAKDLLGF